MPRPVTPPDVRIHLVTALQLSAADERDNLLYMIRSFVSRFSISPVSEVQLQLFGEYPVGLSITVIVNGKGAMSPELPNGMQEEFDLLHVHTIYTRDGNALQLLDYIKYLDFSLFRPGQAVFFIAPTLVMFSGFMPPAAWQQSTPLILSYSSGHTCNGKFWILNYEAMLVLKNTSTLEFQSVEGVFPCSADDEVTEDSDGPVGAVIFHNEGRILFLYDQYDACTITTFPVLFMDGSSYDPGSKFAGRINSFYCQYVANSRILLLITYQRVFLFNEAIETIVSSEIGFDTDKRSIAVGETVSSSSETKSPQSVYIYDWDIVAAPLRGEGNRLHSEYPIFDTKMHSLYEHIYDRMVVSSWRTNDPDVASLYFIPYNIFQDCPSVGDKNRFHKSCPLAKTISGRLLNSTSWHRNLGSDHILVLSALPSKFATHPGCADFIFGFCSRCIIVTIEDTYTTYTNIHSPEFDLYQPNIADSRYIVSPYPSWYHLPPDMIVPPWIDPPDSGHHRIHTVSFIGGQQTNKQRSVLKDLCTVHNNICNWIELAGGGLALELMMMYQTSVFCLMPSGHTYSRKALLDSILAGCIPVVFHVESLHTLYPDFIDVTTALAMSVFYPQSRLDENEGTALLHWLHEIRYSDEIILKRHVIARLARRLQYSFPFNDQMEEAPNLDAFAVMLRSAQTRAINFRRKA